jgi:hypothetical protein
VYFGFLERSQTAKVGRVRVRFPEEDLDMAGADEIKWSKRVKPQSIRRLYALDAKGIVDEDLIDGVGYAMYARCLGIRAVTEAHAGRATCPRCAAPVEEGSAADL